MSEHEILPKISADFYVLPKYPAGQTNPAGNFGSIPIEYGRNFRQYIKFRQYIIINDIDKPIFILYNYLFYIIKNEILK